MPNKRTSDPATVARELLERLGMHTAPVPVDKVARALGAQLRFSPLDEELSGMIYIKDDVPIIGVNALHHPNRQRFTIAHEIGHLAMHRDQLSNTVHVDKQLVILMRNQVSSTGQEQMEVEANRFAAELLMPTDVFEKVLLDTPVDIDDEKPLLELSRKFKVSKQAIEFRIRNLSPLR